MASGAAANATADGPDEIDTSRGSKKNEKEAKKHEVETEETEETKKSEKTKKSEEEKKKGEEEKKKGEKEAKKSKKEKKKSEKEKKKSETGKKKSEKEKKKSEKEKKKSEETKKNEEEKKRGEKGTKKSEEEKKKTAKEEKNRKESDVEKGKEDVKDVKDGIVHLEIGSAVGRWHVDSLIGEGGFGAVYKVSDSAGNQRALKTENVNEKVQILRMEVFVLTSLEARNSTHFCKIFDKGRMEKFTYIVMTLVGKSLTDLRKVRRHKRFSMGTAIGIGIQAVEALRDLHGIGYLHRDVKPANFTVGREETHDLRTIYLLDFGMCRRYIDSKGVIRRPRVAAGFRGTLRYAPLSSHINRELCRKDDLESWLYMQIEITVGGLPWKNLTDVLEVGKMKKGCRSEPLKSTVFRGCPSEFKEILRTIDKVKFFDTPPYKQICACLRNSFATMKVAEFPYDWE